MKIRAHSYGSANVIGRNVERLRKEKNIKQKDFIARLQLTGLDVNPTSYSKLEGQVRTATDKEVYTIAMVLGTTMEALFDSGFVNSAKAAFDRGEEKNEENEPPNVTGVRYLLYINSFYSALFSVGADGVSFSGCPLSEASGFSTGLGAEIPTTSSTGSEKAMPCPSLLRPALR